MVPAPMGTQTTDPRLLRLHPADNVLTVIATLDAGTEISLESGSVRVPTRFAIGHKVAARAIVAGEKIVKYGAPIGSATEAIAAGGPGDTPKIKKGHFPPVFSEEQGKKFFGRFWAKPGEARKATPPAKGGGG